MAGTFKFELVSPERILMSVDVDQVIVPGAEGQFTVLQSHAPVISTLLPGVIHVKSAEIKKSIFVRSGFAEVTADQLTILAERAFIVDEVDPRQLDEELELAQRALDTAETDDARLHVTRAIEQLKALIGEAA
ncbi:MAG: F0F1 ATP synthase subunit epsilon [Alphaproteobacteria bacterium]|nr:F0F1 ATP synthase subunit epsilon [Alphaproteobacteria bacterium]